MAAGKRATHESVADVSRIMFFGGIPRGVVSPGPFIQFMAKSLLPLCPPGGHCFNKKQKLAPWGS